MADHDTDNEAPKVPKSALKNRDDTTSAKPKRSIRFNEDMPTLEDKKGKKLPQTGNSYKHHKKNDPSATTITTYMPSEDNPREFLIQGKFGLGDQNRPTTGRRRKLDPSVETLVNPDAANPHDVQFTTGARSPSLTQATQDMMKNAENFLESKEAKHYAKENLGFNVHDTRGERSVHISKQQTGDYLVVIIYADAKMKEDQRLRAVLTQDQVKDMAQRHIASLSVAAVGKENMPPRSQEPDEPPRKLQRTEGQRGFRQHLDVVVKRALLDRQEAKTNLREQANPDKGPDKPKRSM